MITIDGSTGKGGGKIISTSLALSPVTGQAFRLQNVACIVAMHGA
jgi:RNA 3'-terminal phosphate cyclase (ATP)